LLAVSRRTVYRDIQTLRALGVPIDGEAGVGFVMGPGFVLPPLMLSAEQVEAVVLGMPMVSELGDKPLADAAFDALVKLSDALVKLSQVLPATGPEAISAIGLLSGPRRPAAPGGVDLERLRASIRAEYRIAIDYRDQAGRASTRSIWPIALTFGNKVRLLASWCELRGDFRTFRIVALRETERYPKHWRGLLRAWRQSQGFAVAMPQAGEHKLACPQVSFRSQLGG
jgi:predicted DNA-binding transcriptional regulator YafY